MSSLPPTFYEEVIPSTMKMEDIEHLLQKRYTILKEIEFKSSHPDESSRSQISADVKEYFNWTTNEGIINDLASHFILALACCKSDMERTWFCLQESRLFHNRVKADNYNITETLKKMGIPLQPYQNTKGVESLYSKITFKTLSSNQNQPTQQIFYVPFQYALKLVPTRKYFLYKGNIYVTEKEVAGLIESVFYENALSQISKINGKLNQLMCDTRIKHIINQFERFKERSSSEKGNNEPISNEFQVKTGKDVDTVAERAFPLCMLMIQRHINQNSHLKHVGRLQYTLYLKGIGVPLEEALLFFRRKYEKKTPGDKFEKNYAYNIRHSYGLEGKRSDYTSYSCKKIMMGLNNPASDECHGCPYKTYTEDSIKKLLFSLNFKEKDVFTILDKKRNNEFPICCIKAFEAKFPGCQYEKVGENPVHYFTSAMKAMSKKKIEYEKDKDKSKDKDKDKEALTLTKPIEKEEDIDILMLD